MFASLFRADASGDRSVFGNFWFSDVGSRTGSGARVTAGSALGHPTVFACIRVKAESFAVLPFRLYRPKVGGGRARVTDHWLYRLFAKQPNRFQNPFEWREMLEGHLALRGNAFSQITANGAGEITELLPLHPDRMKIELLDNGSYRYVYTDQTGRAIYYRRDEIWHLRSLSSDGYMGMSPIELMREAIGEGLSMQGYSSRFFANDAKPGGGWIEYPGSFADKATKATFRESWQEMQGGSNRGKVAVLEKGMKYHELSLNNKDAQFIEARAAKDEEIARIWRIPPHKVGILARSTNNNIEQQAIEFWQDCMMPDAERWEASIECQLLGSDTDLEVEFDMRRMMRADSAARGVYYNSGIVAGWLTRNEAREEEGLDPIEGLDEPLRPLNMAENSQAPEELAEPVAPNDKTTQQDDSAPDARFLALVTGNAQRMARRMASGQDVALDVLADALALDVHAAIEWLKIPLADRGTEEQITASLVALALKGNP